jgi:predicted nucleotidyltransferase
MLPTPYSHINALLDHIRAQMQLILGKRLTGLYLYGSLVTGDFDNTISDIDLMAATAESIDEANFEALNRMHANFVTDHPEWNDRLEIAYISLQALKTFRTHTSRIGIISPGEPFHFKEAGKDWLMNWYIVREKGVTLFGPLPEAIIAPISKAEFIQAVKDNTREWREWIYHMAHIGGQAYAILTMCRALYACENGEQVSKIQAAQWAEKALPEWSSIIRNAISWRQNWRDPGVDPATTFPETQRFVNFMIDQIV